MQLTLNEEGTHTCALPGSRFRSRQINNTRWLGTVRLKRIPLARGDSDRRQLRQMRVKSNNHKHDVRNNRRTMDLPNNNPNPNEDGPD